MNEHFEKDVDAWLHLNSAGFVETSGTGRGFSEVLGVLAQNERVVSGVNVSGDWDEIRQGCANIKANLGNAEGLEEFRRNPESGCTSIMTMARVAAGFNPGLDSPGNVGAFKDYVLRLQSAPFFHLRKSDVTKVSQKSKDWNVLINDVARLFDGVKEEDYREIRESLENLAKSAASYKKSKQEKDLLVQNVLAVDEVNGLRRCSVCLCFSHVEFVEDKRKGSTTRQSEFVVAKVFLEFKSEQWYALAPKVWAKTVKTVDDWIDENTTPPGGRAVNLCIGSGSSAVAG